MDPENSQEQPLSVIWYGPSEGICWFDQHQWRTGHLLENSGKGGGSEVKVIIVALCE